MGNGQGCHAIGRSGMAPCYVSSLRFQPCPLKMTDKISWTRLLAACQVVEKLATLYLKEKGFSGPGSGSPAVAGNVKDE
ncbi:hypothetical protein BAGG_02904 [Brucella pinnipedialis M163/99/10]|uniref:Uncharacterized protein n=8 Tax=Brucella TaxID=234 RepID=A9M6Y8_BRUC2|nr:hypothetical protein BOV_1523 [Brucella ovis ATCC 25840]ABX62635.1 Hypothetical protein, conserved [Brucella canis ATCC 23365]EEW90530.1 predicted protein [Brucella suis bv. 4 str. 40]EEX87950.1 predicted protein [Brucella ceti B1/94]EEX91358.1 predicted protein [Brucella ceti M13/05/1]EEX98776.1 predicted protein [Brucella ceti M644/93/1]EEY00903.1 predicted protein [Brucella pinnipedialis B2/94]EEY05112.1 predicted protein [Brucella neotomae 5K33]EEY08267.1 hypothetical protein BAGG_02